MALLSEGSGPQGGTEAMIGHWLSIGLGSVIETIERSLDRAFGLPLGDHIQLDPTPLLRVDFAGRIDGLTKAVQGGLLTPNEARQREGFGKLDGGDDGYLQRQMTPISRINELTAAELESKINPPAPPAPPEPPASGKTPDPVPAKMLELVEQLVAKEPPKPEPLDIAAIAKAVIELLPKPDPVVIPQVDLSAIEAKLTELAQKAEPVVAEPEPVLDEEVIRLLARDAIQKAMN
jgi:hypothetical protein